MDETSHNDNVTFYLVVTATGGSEYISEENVFVTQCAPGSAEIISWPIDDHITY